VTLWSTAAELATTGFPGVNGLKLRGGAGYLTRKDPNLLTADLTVTK
jgi:hypothetical protein